MRNGKKFLAVLSSVVLAVSLTIGIGSIALANADDTSSDLALDMGQAIAENKWKNAADNQPLTVTEGEVTLAAAENAYAYLDQDIERGMYHHPTGESGNPDYVPEYFEGGRVEFAFKATNATGLTSEQGWEFTINIMDTALKPFWNEASSQLCIRYTTAGKLAVDIIDGKPVPAGSIESAGTVTLADGNWHDMAVTVTGDDWNDGRKIYMIVEIDGVKVLEHRAYIDKPDLGYTDSTGFREKFVSGKLSLYTGGNYALSVRAEKPVPTTTTEAPTTTATTETPTTVTTEASTTATTETPTTETPTTAPTQAPAAPSFDFDQAITDGAFKYTDGSAVKVENGVVDALTSGYFYVDQTVNRGDEVEFMIKLKNKNAAPASGWQLTISYMDQAVGSEFWNTGARSINLQLTDGGDYTVGCLNLVYKNGDEAVFNEADPSFDTDVALFDGEWHKLTMKYEQAGEGGAHFTCLIDGQAFVDKMMTTVKGQPFNYDNYFQSGKMVFYAAAQNYDLSLKAVEKTADSTTSSTASSTTPSEGPSVPTFDFAQAVKDGAFKYTDGGKVEVVDGVVNALNSGYFYIDKTVNRGDQVEFMIKLDSLTGKPHAGWALAISLMDQAVGTPFWKEGARSINLQLTDGGDYTLGSINLVYKDGSTDVFNVADSSSESDIALFDGKWHKLTMKVDTAADGSARILCLIDGEDFVDKTIAVEGVDLNEYFENGKMVFYAADQPSIDYNLSLKAVDAPKPPVETGEAGIAAALVLAAAGAAFVIVASAKKKKM